MGLVGLTFLGIVLGAAGSELLRAKKPELVKTIEDSAKRLEDSLFSSKSTDRDADEK